MNTYYIAYLVSLLLCGTSGIAAGFIHLSSYEIVLLRFGLATILLFVVYMIRYKGRFTFYRHKRSFVFLVLAGLILGVNVLFLFEAYQQVGVPLGILGDYCGPALVMLFSPILFHEKLTIPKLLCFAVVVLGVVLVNGQVFLEGSSGWGLFCCAMSGVTLGVMIVCNKYSTEIQGIESSLLTFAICSAVIAVFVVSQQGFTMTIVPTDWPAILFMSLISTGIGNNLNISSMKHLPAQSVSVLGYLEPMTAVVLSALILHQTMSSTQILGALCILGGAIACERMPKKREAETL